MHTTRDTSVIQVTIREIIGADRRRRERRNFAATSRDAYRRREYRSSCKIFAYLQNLTIIILLLYLIKNEFIFINN